MGKTFSKILGAVEIAVGLVTGNFLLVATGALTLANAFLAPSMKSPSNSETLQLGEVGRSGIFGTGSTMGSLVDAFNYGGKYDTDWTLMIIAVADHYCDGLEGFYVRGKFVPYVGDGVVDGFREQLEIYWRPGAWDDDVPGTVLFNSPTVRGVKTWTANDRGRGVAKVYVAYKADKPDQKHPVWSGDRPTFQFIVRGLRCYDPRKDDTVGGSGPHRWNDPATREFSDNLALCRETWERGIYAGDKVDQPEMLLLGRGLTEVESPPQNVFAAANLCDETVDLKGVTTSLSEDAEEGDHSIKVGSVNGLASGMTISIVAGDDFSETKTVLSVAGLTVTLTAGLAHDHPALTPVKWSTDADHPATEKRYTIGGAFGGDDAFIDTEQKFMAACGGWLVEREGSVELIPGAAQPVVWDITDDDIVVGANVSKEDFRSYTDQLWCNSVTAKYIEPAQQWTDHSAPVHRKTADIVDDGEPRDPQPNLGMVTSGTQAQRIAEQIRRQGRLWAQRSLTLGPRFIGVEHGDWIRWTSKRYGRPNPNTGVVATDDGSDILTEDGGKITLDPTEPIVFRVDSDSQDEKWQNSIVLTETAASVFDWNPQTDELADLSVGLSQDDPNYSEAPTAGTWTLAATIITGDGTASVALLFSGAADNDSVDSIVFEYAAGTAAPSLTDDNAWTIGNFGTATTTRAEITGVMTGTTYWGAVSYRIAGTRSDRLLLGPVTTASSAELGPDAGRISSEDGARVLGEDGDQIIKE